MLHIVRVERHLENHVDLAGGKSVQLVFHGVVAIRFKLKRRVFQAVRRIANIVGDDARDLARCCIYLANVYVTNDKAHTNRTVLISPVALCARKSSRRRRGEVLLVQLIVVERVIVSDTRHGRIEVGLKVAAVLVYRKVHIGVPDIHNGLHVVLVPGFFYRDKAIHGARVEVCKDVLGRCDVGVGGGYAVIGLPGVQHVLGHGAHHYAHRFAIDGA